MSACSWCSRSHGKSDYEPWCSRKCALEHVNLDPDHAVATKKRHDEANALVGLFLLLIVGGIAFAVFAG